MTGTSEGKSHFGSDLTAGRPVVTSGVLDDPVNDSTMPRRSRHARNRAVILLNFAISGLVLLLLAGAVAVYAGKAAFESAGPLKESTLFMVRRSAGVQEIAATLESRGLIRDSSLFMLGTRLYGHDSALKAGEYEIPAGASMQEIMELFNSGRSVLYSLTIPEGFTVAQAFERIAENEILIGDMPAELPDEGSLVADTMRFTRGTSRMDIIQKMLNEQEKLVEQIWQSRVDNLPFESRNEFLTLASIVEKETAVDSERARIAGVFINRLKRGMRLQSDPTIIYGLFGGAGKPAGRAIYQSDIDKPTAYNTYTINGLPPGPIANPGRAALEAVANPERSTDLYFVADGTGGHAFAGTLREHNNNVARWRKIEREQRKKSVTQGGNGKQDRPVSGTQ